MREYGFGEVVFDVVAQGSLSGLRVLANVWVKRVSIEGRRLDFAIRGRCSGAIEGVCEERKVLEGKIRDSDKIMWSTIEKPRVAK